MHKVVYILLNVYIIDISNQSNKRKNKMYNQIDTKKKSKSKFKDNLEFFFVIGLYTSGFAAAVELWFRMQGI